MKEKIDKKKIKSFLIKLAVFLVMLGISIATSNVNLWQKLADFQMRFYNAAVDTVKEEDEKEKQNDTEKTQTDDENDSCDIDDEADSSDLEDEPALDE